MAYQDVALTQTADGYYDLSITDGDFTKVDNFTTAIQLSLIGSDRRASVTEEPIPQLRRGWIGNQYQPVEYGSKIWLLTQARLTNETVNRARTYCQQALDWLVSYGYAHAVSVTTERDLKYNSLTAKVKIQPFEGITETHTYLLWMNTP